MNFLSAIKHAAIDYGIRRRAWARRDAILCLGNGTNGCELYWIDGVGKDTPVKLCGTDAAFDLIVEDIQAQDWEVV